MSHQPAVIPASLPRRFGMSPLYAPFLLLPATGGYFRDRT